MNAYASHYKLSRRLVHLVGMWPDDSSAMKSVKRAFFSVCISSFMIVQICTLFTTKVTLDLCIDIIPPVLFCALSLTKYFSYWIHGTACKGILETLETECARITEAGELEILRASTDEARLYIWCYISFCYSGTLLFLSLQYIPCTLDLIVPLNESRPNYHPFTAEYFVDDQEYFYTILAHQQISILLGITTIVSVDSLTVALLVHMSALFTVFGHRLEHAFDDEAQTYYERRELGENRENTSLKIKNAVQYHTRLSTTISLTMNKFAPSYVVQLTLIVITLTGLLLQLHKALTKMDDIGFLILTAFRVIGHFLVVFLNIIPAQRIVDCSGDVYIQAYSGLWYAGSVRAQKLLLIVMQRTLEPTKLSVGNILYMTFEIFATIVQLTFSYFTVIHSVQQ